MIGRAATIGALAMIGVAVGVSGSESAQSGPPRGSIVFYLTGLSSTEGMCAAEGCEWRTFDPRTGEDRLFLALPTPPSHVFWDTGFGALYYLRESTLFRAEWRYNADPQNILTLPPNLDQPHERAMGVWHDEERDVWTLTTLSSSAASREMAHVWEQSAADQTWRRTRSVPTQCDKNGSICMEEVSEPSQLVERVSLEQIREEMRIETHLIRTGQNSDGEKLYNLPSRSEPESTIRVQMRIGDSAHAWHPLSVVLASGKEHAVELGAGCSQQLAFADVDGFLLLGTEWVGRCSKIVDLRTGRIVRSLPERSRWAVWTPPPRADESQHIETIPISRFP